MLGLEPGHCTEFSKVKGSPCCGVRWKGMLARWGTAPGQCRLHLTMELCCYPESSESYQRP